MMWKDVMDWPIDANWECETCNCTCIGIDNIGLIFSVLTWGLVHGECRCNRCHTQYTMRYDGEVQTTPKCLLKPEYKDAARALWGKYQIPIDEFTDSDWDEALEALTRE